MCGCRDEPRRDSGASAADPLAPPSDGSREVEAAFSFFLSKRISSADGILGIEARGRRRRYCCGPCPAFGRSYGKGARTSSADSLEGPLPTASSNDENLLSEDQTPRPDVATQTALRPDQQASFGQKVFCDENRATCTVPVQYYDCTCTVVSMNTQDVLYARN